MSAKLHHEIIYRGKEQIDKLADASLIVCGAGALGSNLVANLVRQGFRKIKVIDRDHVEERNLGTQVYSLDDVGGLKAEILQNLIYRDVCEEIEAVAKELNEKNAASLLKDADLVIDTFDNSVSRALVKTAAERSDLQCLHIGVNGDFGEIRWNESYIVPSDAGDDICDYPLARNLIMLVVAVAGEVLTRYFLSGRKESYSITLADFGIHEIES